MVIAILKCSLHVHHREPEEGVYMVLNLMMKVSLVSALSSISAACLKLSAELKAFFVAFDRF